MFWIMVW
jgi:hypothetical protein